MKRTILILLILCAIPLYSYNVYLLVKRSIPHSDKKTASVQLDNSFENWITRSQKVQFNKSGKSPFSPFKDQPTIKTQVAEQKIVKNLTPKKVVEKPSIKITGMMWSPTNPVAMVILPDGSSTIVKEGGNYGDITVKKIEKNRIQVICNKVAFWIEK